MAECDLNRRQFLKGAGAAAIATAAMAEAALPQKGKPSSPVALARCDSYELAQVLRGIETSTDRIGGLRKLAAGKTVTVKVNMVNTPSQQAVGLPSNRTYQIHPSVARALAILLDRAGAKRIRFVESSFSREPIESFFTAGGWNLRDFEGLKTPVEFEDTRNLGRGKQYYRLKVPWGGSLYSAYDLNHSYVDCDVYISLAKLKNHAAAGVTLSMKNNFGITPTSLYGGPEPKEDATSNRASFHGAAWKVAKGLPQEVNPDAPRKASYLVPRHIVDAVGIRPIDLAIIDGVESVSGGEGPWIGGLKRQTPHLLIAGRNPVCTDAIGTACMGYDPLSKSAAGPFPGDNHLAMAAELGLGTANPKEIEVVGLPLAKAIHPYNWQPSERNT